MNKYADKAQFAALFKRFRLRSEIETLAEFGDLLAEEGMVYESSLFTKWQKGDRVPRDRKTLFTIVRVFSKKGGVKFLHEVNNLLEAAGQGYATESEMAEIPGLHKHATFQAPRTIEHFVGRSSYIKKVGNTLIGGKTVLLYGQPGIGKTVLASDIAHQVSKFFPDGVFWYQLNSSSLMDILASIAESFGHNIRNIQDITIRSSIVRSVTAKKKILFVFDNLEKEEDLLYIIPNDGSCGVLITSIHPCISTQEINIRLSLQPFTRVETLSLFAEILGEVYVKENKQDILELYNTVEGLPLALHVLAKHILYHKKSIHTLTLSVLSTRTNLSHFSYGNKDLHSVLQICYGRLNQQEQRIFSSTSIFYGTDFSTDAIAAVNAVSKTEAEHILENLWNFSLIEQSEFNRYRIHPFIRIFLRPYLDPSAYLKALRYYHDEIIKKQKTYFSFVHKELDNILPLIDHGITIETWPYISEIGSYLSDYLWNSGLWDKLKKYSQHLYKLSGKYKDYEIKIRTCLIPLSLVYYWRNDIPQAEKYIRAGLKLAEKIQDEYLIYLGRQRLGRILIGTNKFNKSQKLLLDAYNYFSSLSDPTQVVLTQINLAEISLRKNHLEESSSTFQAAKIACHNINDISLRYICLSEILFYIGAICILKNDWNGALNYFKEGLNHCKKINEYSEISTAGYIGLGLCYERENELSKAKKCFYKVREQIEFLGIKESMINQDTFFYALKLLIKKSPLFKSLLI